MRAVRVLVVCTRHRMQAERFADGFLLAAAYEPEALLVSLEESAKEALGKGGCGAACRFIVSRSDVVLPSAKEPK